MKAKLSYFASIAIAFAIGGTIALSGVAPHDSFITNLCITGLEILLIISISITINANMEKNKR